MHHQTTCSEASGLKYRGKVFETAHLTTALEAPSSADAFVSKTSELRASVVIILTDTRLDTYVP